MSTHTPGPWTFRKRTLGGDIYYDIDTACGLPRYQNREQVGTVNSGFGYMTEGEANARLIAAAPALLEALEHIVKVDLRGSDDLEHLVALARGMQIAARKAIQQATNV